MRPPKLYSLADVRASYTKEKAWQELSGALPAYFLYRPVSFPIAWLLLRLRVPIAGVTSLSLSIAIALPLVAAMGGERAALWIVLLGLGFHVLDCVDGNMARTAGEATVFGALLDGFADYAFWSALLFSIGLLAAHERSWVSPYATELGLGTAALILLNRHVRDHFELRVGRAAVLDEPVATAPSARQWLLFGVSGLEHVYVFALLLGWWQKTVGAVLLGICAYAGCVSLAAIVLTLRRARLLDRTRSSDAAQHETAVLAAEAE